MKAQAPPQPVAVEAQAPPPPVAMEYSEWLPLTECPQYKSGMLHPYLGKFDFEDRPDVDDSYFYSSDDEEEDRIENTLEVVKEFLKQVRESRGYDVDCVPPHGFGSPFTPRDVSIALEDNDFREYVMKAIQVAIDKINEVTGKTYKLGNVEKVVETRNLMLLLTFTVDADAGAAVRIVQAMVYTPAPFVDFILQEWRFKPVPASP